MNIRSTSCYLSCLRASSSSMAREFERSFMYMYMNTSIKYANYMQLQPKHLLQHLHPATSQLMLWTAIKPIGFVSRINLLLYSMCLQCPLYERENVHRTTRQKCVHVHCTTTALLSLQRIIISYTCTCVTYESALYMQFSILYRTCIMWSRTCIQCSIVIAHFCTYTCTYMYYVYMYMYRCTCTPCAMTQMHG